MEILNGLSNFLMLNYFCTKREIWLLRTNNAENMFASFVFAESSLII